MRKYSESWKIENINQLIEHQKKHKKDSKKLTDTSALDKPDLSELFQ